MCSQRPASEGLPIDADEAAHSVVEVGRGMKNTAGTFKLMVDLYRLGNERGIFGEFGEILCLVKAIRGSRSLCPPFQQPLPIRFPMRQTFVEKISSAHDLQNRASRGSAKALVRDHQDLEQ